MAITFDFNTAQRILFGPGKIIEVGEIIRSYGLRISIISGLPEGKIIRRLIEILDKSGVKCQLDSIFSEPTIQNVSELLSRVKSFLPDAVIGIGGGSAMDTAKAVSALLTNPGEIIDYLEVIGRGKQIVENPLPMIAIPTTSGTGSEVTRNAVIGDTEHHIKVSLRSPLLIPKVALVDPELTIDLPPSITASTGMDAITQLIESFTSNKSNPITDALCKEGLGRAVRSLRETYYNGGLLAARQDMALASLLSGIALANSKLGVVHGFAAVLGGMFDAPHGAICARLLPFAIGANFKAITEREMLSETVNKYAEIAKIITGHREASIEDGIFWLHRLSNELQINPLRHIGLDRNLFDVIVQQTKKASSTQGNPIRLSDAELLKILDQAY
jgi:alcohol dehydrogenase class IV